MIVDLDRVTLVLGTSAGGTGTHVWMLAAGLAARGLTVTVAGPSSAEQRFSFGDLPSVTFTPVEIGDRPRPGDRAVIARLRQLLGQPGAGGHVVHAHGLRAGALTLLALRTVPAAARPRTVVTVHNAPPAGAGPARSLYRVLARVVARRADLVLCVSPDLSKAMRTAGAHRVVPAVIAGPDPVPGAPAVTPASLDSPGRPVDGRPVVLAVGRLAAQKRLDTLIDAAASWRHLDPAPVVLIAGQGPLAGQLRQRAARAGVDVRFLGQVRDVPALLAAATVFVLPSQWEGQPLALREALRAGLPVVASDVGGVAGVTGPAAALLVPPGDVPALAAAVIGVLTDPALASRLSAAAAARGVALPGPDDAIAAALSAYAAVVSAYNRVP